MLCGNCGHDNPTDNRFCGMCGMRMERIPVPQRESSRSEYRELVRQRIGTPPEAADAMRVESGRTPEPPKEVISFDPANGREHGSRDESQSARGNGNAVEPTAPRPRQRAVSGPSFLNLEVPAEPARNENGPGQTISGPSFLGLADDGGTREGRYNIDYLLDDEPRESHWRLWLVLIILGLFGVLAWLQLRHAGVDVAGLMQRLRQAKLGTVAEQTHPTTGSSDAAPVEGDKSSQAPQAIPATPTNGATAGSGGNQPAGQPGSADATKSTDATKNDTAKSADQSKSPQQSDLAGKGSSATGAAPELKQPGPDNGKSSEQAASDQAASPDKSSAEDETSGSANASKTAHPATVAKNTMPKKPSASVDNSEARAAREQNAQGAALVATGEKYLYGRGVPQNCERAISYLRKASDIGNAKGSSHLGAMYATGQCLPMDRVRAYKYFAVALHQDSSNQYFQHNLEMLWNEMSADEKQQATARTPAQ